MRIDRGRLGWGVFFIAVGAMPLAYRAGVIPLSAITDAWKLWPLILVGLGLGFILERTPAAFVGGLVVACMLGAIVGSALTVVPAAGCGTANGGVATTRDGSFSGPGSVTLRLQCGSVSVGASNDAGWHVTAMHDAGREPAISSDASSLTMSSENGIAWGNGSAEAWHVLLPADGSVGFAATLDFGDSHVSFEGARLASTSITLNMGSVHVDLTGGSVGRLSLSTNLGAAWLELDGSSDLQGSLSTSLGSLDVCAPTSLGLRIRSSDSLGSSDMGAFGMTLVNGYWQSPGYDQAAHRADLTASTSLGSFKLHDAGGCK